MIFINNNEINQGLPAEIATTFSFVYSEFLPNWTFSLFEICPTTCCQKILLTKQRKFCLLLASLAYSRF